MSTTTNPHSHPGGREPGGAGERERERSTAPAPARRGRWIAHWDPEDPVFWRTTGARVARRNLILSILTDHLGFIVWTIWTVVVINLANAGIKVSLADQFLLTATPNLIGALLRIPYTFAVPRFGGRAWTTISAVLLLIPCVLLAVVVPSGWLARQDHAVQLWVLLGCAATAGLGGGNFSSSMANISFFYPQRRKGLALGINAAGGNLGVAVSQLLVALVIVIGVPASAIELAHHPVHLAYAGLVWMPVIALVALGAWLGMDSLEQARSDAGGYAAALRRGQTWVVSLLYVGTFGSFIGFSFALPVLIKGSFPAFLAHHRVIAVYLAGLSFAGPLLGSLARPLGGWLADRLGGARVTLGCLLGLAAGSLAAIVAVQARSFAGFLASFAVVFVCAGAGNGSTYRMIPAVFAALAGRKAGDEGSLAREAAGAIGIAGAVGALGGFLIQLTLRQASLPLVRADAAAAAHLHAGPALASALARIGAAHAGWPVGALWAFVVCYLLLAVLTWFFYLRRSLLSALIPSLAAEGI